MVRILRLPDALRANAGRIALALGGAFLLRRVIGSAVSVVAMLTVGRVLLTALKVDLALAERRYRTPSAERREARADPADRASRA